MNYNTLRAIIAVCVAIAIVAFLYFVSSMPCAGNNPVSVTHNVDGSTTEVCQ